MNPNVRSLIQFNHPIFDEIETNCRTYKKQEFDELIVVEFDLHFATKGGGYAFPCDSAGNVIVEELPAEAGINYNFCLSCAEKGCWDKIHVRPYIKRYRTCDCGSGLDPEEQYDARGIYITRACSKCVGEKLRGYRHEVLTNSNYECDELIESDY